jgi:DNA-directed RNA polymerase beta subunit
MDKKTVNPILLNVDRLTEEDLIAVINSELSTQTLIGHHVQSFNNFMSTGINQIITQGFSVQKEMQNQRNKTVEDQQIEYISFAIKFDDAKTHTPLLKTLKETAPLFPYQARANRLNYSSDINVDVTITAKAILKDGKELPPKVEKISNITIASMPVMVGSESCNLHGLNSKSKKQIFEDPNDLGGYFILKGGEWVISMVETRLFNQPHIFRNVGHEKEIARLEFISKPGDAYENSSEIKIRLVTNGNIYIQFTSDSKLKHVNIPFFIVFRLLGMTTDKEIIDNVIYGYSTAENIDVVSDTMLAIIKKAMISPDTEFSGAVHITEQSDLLKYMADKVATVYYTKNTPQSDKSYENLNNSLIIGLLKLFDKLLLPHIGLAADSRHTKLRYLGRLIHKMLLVEMQIMPSTDRDSLKNKRINAAGKQYAKTFKKHFNINVVQEAKNELEKAFKNSPFQQVQLAQRFRDSINRANLEKALIQVISTGNKELSVGNNKVMNDVVSEMLHRKNQLNMISILRENRTPRTSSSKQDQRADEMRRFHPSYTGYLCCIQTAVTGEQVGMVKQLALSASVSESGSSELLKETLLRDPEIIPLHKVFPEKIHEKNLTCINVNGYWIGCCEHSHRLVQKYKEMRRGYRATNNISSYENVYTYVGNKDRTDNIDSMTTIYWDVNSNEINFWIDSGRLLRPILVVRNNGELDSIGRNHFKSKYDPIKNTGFVQDVMITPEQISDLMQEKINTKTLHELGIIDYISPEELENCYIASSLTELHENKNNPLRQYTHCEIPQALVGVAALTCPFAGHNQAPRIAYQTSQVKQTCGWFALNWPYRVDKHAFLQYYCEIPLIKTLANKYIYPNGLNTVVMILSKGFRF